MNKYNEKQLEIVNDFRRKQLENFETYQKARKVHLDAMNDEAREFDFQKNSLAIQLQAVLNNRAELRRKGLQNFSVEMQNSFAEETAIHEKQRNNRRAFFDSRAAHKRLIGELHDACCGTGAFLSNLMQEQLKKLDKELKEEKELQSKNQDNE